MFKYSIGISILAFSLIFNVNGLSAGEMEMHLDNDDASILELAPLVVGCTEETATLTNVIDLDRSKFLPNCVKISLSANPVIKCTTFDFARHDVIILKEDVSFNDRVVSYDMTAKSRVRLPEEWSYDFSTGEFLPKPDENNASFSEINTGEGIYNIWCRYHLLSGMTMRLIVVP